MVLFVNISFEFSTGPSSIIMYKLFIPGVGGGDKIKQGGANYFPLPPKEGLDCYVYQRFHCKQ